MAVKCIKSEMESIICEIFCSQYYMKSISVGELWPSSRSIRWPSANEVAFGMKASCSYSHAIELDVHPFSDVYSKSGVSFGESQVDCKSLS